MKNYFLIAVLLITSVSARTQTHCVVFETTQNERLEYLFSDNPRIEHQDSQIVLTTDQTTVVFNTTDVVKVSISDIDTDTAIHENVAKKVSFSNEHIRLMNFTPFSAVTLSNIEGQLIQQQTVHNDGSLAIPLSQLPSGVYVVRTKCQTFKFTRK